MANPFGPFARANNGIIQFNDGSGPLVDPVGFQGLNCDSENKIYSNTGGDIDHYHNGLPFDVDGRLVVQADYVISYDQGMPFTFDGRLCIGDAIPITYDQGIAFSASGGMTQEGAGSLPLANLLLTVGSASPYMLIQDTSDPLPSNWTIYGTPAEPPTGNLRSGKFNIGGLFIAIGGDSPDYLIVYDVATLTRQAIVMPDASVRAIAWNNKGTLLVAGNASFLPDAPIDIYSVPDFVKISTVPEGFPVTQTCYGVDFNKAGDILAVALGAAPFLALYDTSDWTLMPSPASSPTQLTDCVAFSADGAYLAVGSNDTPFIRVYDTSDWSLLPPPAALPSGKVVDVSWSIDGAFLYCGVSANPDYAMYDTSDWSAIGISPVPVFNVYGSDFDPESRWMYTAGGNLFPLVYEYGTWAELANPPEYLANTVYAVSFA